MHLVGLDVPVMEQLYKLCSINLCPNTAGQVGLAHNTYVMMYSKLHQFVK